MNSVQKKFFELLEAAAEKENLEVVLQTEWANTGTLHLQEQGSFDTWLSIPYAFQGKLDLGWMASYHQGADVFPTRPNPSFAGFKTNELDEAITSLIEYAVTQRDLAHARA